jgi:hypothetical protein
MQHAEIVGGGQSSAQLSRHLNRLVRRQPPDTPQQRRQVLTVDVLHRQEWLAVRFREIVDAADVGMGDLTRDANFVVKSSNRAWIPAHRRRQEFQGDRLSELQVVGAIDLAHAAAAEETDDAIALGENRAGCARRFARK